MTTWACSRRRWSRSSSRPRTRRSGQPGSVTPPPPRASGRTCATRWAGLHRPIDVRSTPPRQPVSETHGRPDPCPDRRRHPRDPRPPREAALASRPTSRSSGVAASGREALEMAAELTPDVVLMDINMPDMDGIATTEQLSAEVPTAAVVMMSVQGEADYLRRSMLAGAREFLVKPFTSRRAVARRSGRSTPGSARRCRGWPCSPPPATRAAWRVRPPRRREREAGRAGPRHHGVRAQGRGRSHDARRQPRRRHRDRAGPARRASWTPRSSSVTSASCSTSTPRTSPSRT